MWRGEGSRMREPRVLTSLRSVFEAPKTSTEREKTQWPYHSSIFEDADVNVSYPSLRSQLFLV